MKIENYMRSFCVFITLFFFGKTYSQTNTWTGATDTDWHKACNWSLSSIPTCAHNVVIPNVTNYPIVSNIAHCNQIDITSTDADALTIQNAPARLDVGLGGSCSGTPTDNGGCGPVNCPTPVWSQTVATYSANDLAADAGGLYVVGETFFATSNSQWRFEKRNLTTGAIIWQQSSNPSNNRDICLGIALDGTGVYGGGYEAATLFDVRWRIEKRNLTTGAIIWQQTENVGGSNSEMIYDLAIDGTGVYLVGYDANNGNQWRMQKRSLTTGGVLWTQTYNSSAGSEIGKGIAVDATGVYIVGTDNSLANQQWRIQKRNLTTGALIWNVTSNPGAGLDDVKGIDVDASGVYIAGYVFSGDTYWQIEKRSLTTGALIGAFGTGGVVTSNPSGGYDRADAVIVNGSDLYIGGLDENAPNRQWRMEKRNATTGALSCIAANNPSAANSEGINNLTISPAGNVYAAGYQTSITNGVWRVQQQCACP